MLDGITLFLITGAGTVSLTCLLGVQMAGELEKLVVAIRRLIDQLRHRD